MAGLATANNIPNDSHARERSRQITVAVVLAVVTGVIWAGFKFVGNGPPAAKRQVARIALLPDTPPPPPPPPPPKPKIEPRNETPQQIEKQKLDTPPPSPTLKMEGAAGDGPSPYGSGEVKNDYIGGEVGGGGSRYAGYVGRVVQVVQEELARRNLRIASARVFLWLRPDGTVDRYEVSGVSGDAERGIRSAMAGMGRLPEAPPSDMPMPMGLEISQR